MGLICTAFQVRQQVSQTIVGALCDITRERWREKSKRTGRQTFLFSFPSELWLTGVRLEELQLGCISFFFTLHWTMKDVPLPRERKERRLLLRRVGGLGRDAAGTLDLRSCKEQRSSCTCEVDVENHSFTRRAGGENWISLKSDEAAGERFYCCTSSSRSCISV